MNDGGYVTSSYATGNVTGTGTDPGEAGGLVGTNGKSGTSDGGEIRYSYATGTVSGQNSVGGLVGYNNENATVLNSHATGAVSGGNYVGGLVGVNTMHPNRLVAEALALDRIPELGGYASVRREVNYGDRSRVDFLLEGPDRPPCWLEIKNCHLSRTPGLAEFPDCVAARSSRHLRELAAMVEAGHRAAALFVVQRTDCDRFSACAELDPVFARTLDEVAARGVEVLVYGCAMSETAITLERRLAWVSAA
jgi:sugar fermentation stimulation protein